MTTQTTLTVAQVNAAIKRITVFAQSNPASDIIALWQGQAWKVTGHKDWATFCAERISGFKYTTIARRTMLPELVAAGMRQREIAAAVNVKQPQIPQDLAAIRALSGDSDNAPADDSEGDSESAPRTPKSDAEKAGEALAKALKLIKAIGVDLPDSIREAVHELDALVNVRATLAPVVEIAPENQAPATPVKRTRARKAA